MNLHYRMPFTTLSTFSFGHQWLRKEAVFEKWSLFLHVCKVSRFDNQYKLQAVKIYLIPAPVVRPHRHGVQRQKHSGFEHVTLCWLGYLFFFFDNFFFISIEKNNTKEKPSTLHHHQSKKESNILKRKRISKPKETGHR